MIQTYWTVIYAAFSLHFPRSAEAKWHIPSTKILNPLKQREGSKDSPNKLSRVNVREALISLLTEAARVTFSRSVLDFIGRVFLKGTVFRL